MSTSKIDETTLSSFVTVGRVQDAHGIRGELFITLFAGEAAWLKKVKELRLVKHDSKGEVVQRRQFSITSARLHKNGLIITTGEIKDRNEAETLKGWLMEIPDALFVSKKGEALYLREILGFRVFTVHKGEIGVIEGFGTNTVQDLLNVKTSWGTFEIPFVKAFVQNIDYDKKQIHLDIPVGLLGEEIEDSVPDEPSPEEASEDESDEPQ